MEAALDWDRTPYLLIQLIQVSLKVYSHTEGLNQDQVHYASHHFTTCDTVLQTETHCFDLSCESCFTAGQTPTFRSK